MKLLKVVKGQTKFKTREFPNNMQHLYRIIQHPKYEMKSGFGLFYKDSEGDFVQLGSEEDFAIMIEEFELTNKDHNKQTLTVFVDSLKIVSKSATAEKKSKMTEKENYSAREVTKYSPFNDISFSRDASTNFEIEDKKNKNFGENLIDFSFAKKKGDLSQNLNSKINYKKKNENTSTFSPTFQKTLNVPAKEMSFNSFRDDSSINSVDRCEAIRRCLSTEIKKEKAQILKNNQFKENDKIKPSTQIDQIQNFSQNIENHPDLERNQRNHASNFENALSNLGTKISFGFKKGLQKFLEVINHEQALDNNNQSFHREQSLNNWINEEKDDELSGFKLVDFVQLSCSACHKQVGNIHFRSIENKKVTLCQECEKKGFYNDHMMIKLKGLPTTSQRIYLEDNWNLLVEKVNSLSRNK